MAALLKGERGEIGKGEGGEGKGEGEGSGGGGKDWLHWLHNRRMARQFYDVNIVLIDYCSYLIAPNFHDENKASRKRIVENIK